MSKIHEIRKNSKNGKNATTDEAAENRKDNLTPNGVPGVSESATVSFNGAQATAKKGDRTFEPLTVEYIEKMVASLMRNPSISLKHKSPQFYADLQVRAELMSQAAKLATTPADTFVKTLMAEQVGGGALDASKLVRDAARQLLWLFSMDVQRDRRVASERDDSNDVSEEAYGKYPGGEERPAPPTEDEARIAYAEAHAWLSTLADLLPASEDERIYLNLENGLEYAQVNKPRQDGEANWVMIYDFEEALASQIVKNEATFAAKAARHVENNKAKFAALAAMVA